MALSLKTSWTVPSIALVAEFTCPPKEALVILKLTHESNRGAGDCPSPHAAPRRGSQRISQRILLPAAGVDPASLVEVRGVEPAGPCACERARENEQLRPSYLILAPPGTRVTA